MKLFFLLILITGVIGLKNVKIKIPLAVQYGQNVIMQCSYDLEGAELYSVKWYKGRQEFYRYVPRELPHIKVFPMLGINVDISLSGPNEIVLRNVNWDLSGKYRCEVSTDAPEFHTEMVASHMHVVEIPLGKPLVVLEKSHYSLGETVRGNCTSELSYPAANLTWLVNEKQVNCSFEEILAFETEAGDPRRLTKTAGIEFQVNSFHTGKLRIRCMMDIYGRFNMSNEIILEEEKPKLASILGTFNSSTGIRSLPSMTFMIIILRLLPHVQNTITFIR